MAILKEDTRRLREAEQQIRNLQEEIRNKSRDISNLNIINQDLRRKLSQLTSEFDYYTRLKILTPLLNNLKHFTNANQIQIRIQFLLEICLNEIFSQSKVERE